MHNIIPLSLTGLMPAVASNDPIERTDLAYTVAPVPQRPARRLCAMLKRGLDILGAAAGLLLLAPLLAVMALLVKAEDGGPVFFRQQRVGRGGRLFWCPKFRSMVTNAEALKKDLLARNEHGDGITFKIKRDPRITRIGAFIRKTSIDELPQLWSVLTGDMSLVGPRPALPNEVARYRREDLLRLAVKPGLTCFWQVQGRGDLPFERQVQLDIRYVEQRNVLLDLRLLLQTVPAVLAGRGAY